MKGNKRKFISIFVFLVLVMIFSACGKKGPPEMIEKSKEQIKAVHNFKYKINKDYILLKWDSDNQHGNVEGFDIFMAKQNIKKCKECPVTYIKIDSVPWSVKEYKKKLEQGTRYFFKIISFGIGNNTSPDSKIIQIEYK
jgi:predicted small lipoprotein YifL